uniref:Nucleolar GTP-binding protein 2 n=1 Tax=Compsopogon caeruleus TaxID=31354 RepID=A0A6T6BP81_9RHOD|eukprot:CAMPEP_0184679868 /NCGR_PEP_ID=MMETSP0312-20130426/2751_1 /TAXON_ID=31354 /ORGANISM="Compsopogon coeruleus, Strain SAG 36.94" /LENGTH=532 /DNA_ID=CAMNT_0027129613 /DNA_START=56 /DNA_END=1654 /DNA_ORIENTATION=+
MPKLKVENSAGIDGRAPKHSNDTTRRNRNEAGSLARDRSTVKRLKMYSRKAYKRDRKGRIVQGAGDLTSSIPEVGAGRVAPNRRWFGNTRTVDQKDLERFREQIGQVRADPYSVLMKKRKVPLGLLAEGTPGRELEGEKLGLLAVEPFEETFSKGRWRKRPKLSSGSRNLEALAQHSSQRTSKFEEDATEAEPSEFATFKDVDKDKVFDKGQSRRIWGELHKVVDSSDVILQVIDARDPLGTRCAWLERFVARDCPHKHIVLILNKCDLVPTWVTSRWLRILSREYPTLAFHSSINNSFGKGSLINLLRQFRKLHSDRKSISCGLVGYPNVGKSSVINTLRGKKVVNVAPVPGETKVWQYITLFKQIYLVDCPGVVHESGKDNDVDAVLKGVVRVESLRDDSARFIPAVLERVKVEHVEQAYGVKGWLDADDFLENLARKSGKLLKKGEPDTNMVARRVLLDFQRGKIPWFVPPPDERMESETKEREYEVLVPEQNLDQLGRGGPQPNTDSGSEGSERLNLAEDQGESDDDS